jgi:putative Mn2+ efflux pump MntP
MMRPVGGGLILFAISVSLDSFSAGLSFGMLGAKTALTVLMIGLVSMVLSWLGLVMGSRFKQYIGSYGELLGGFILIGFGIKLIFPV